MELRTSNYELRTSNFELLRHGLFEDGYDIRTIQELLGHRSVKTTMIYIHVLHRRPSGVVSPLDRLPG